MIRSKKFPELESGGQLWFPDMTIPDSSNTLPFIAVGCSYLSIHIGEIELPLLVVFSPLRSLL
jgi:hypothetical protein